MSAVEERMAAIFVAQVRDIDNRLGNIVKDHLDRGYSLSTVKAMLEDAVKVAAKARGESPS